MNRIHKALQAAKLIRELGDGYDCNIVGLVGEIVAEEQLQMVKAPRQTKGIDGRININGEERTVQVKSLSSSRVRQSGRTATFKVCTDPEPERLVVVVVPDMQADYRIIFNGSTNSVGKKPIRSTQRRPISLQDLYCDRMQELEELIHLCERDT